jgi:hypothetical protein
MTGEDKIKILEGKDFEGGVRSLFQRTVRCS